MDWIRRHRPAPRTAFGLAALVVALGGVAFAAIPDSSGTIHACYQKSTGNVRVVETSSDCRSSERPLAWNERGATGPQGATGTTGAQGPTGATGPQGASGDSLTTVVPAARVESSVSQSSGTGPITSLVFDVESFDTAALHNADHPSRLTAPIDGIYQITGGVFWDDPGTSGVRAIQILENGVDCHLGGCKAEAVQGPASAAAGGFQTVQSVSTILNLQANDFVQLGVAHNFGESPLILGKPHDSTFFGMAWIGPLP